MLWTWSPTTTEQDCADHNYAFMSTHWFDLAHADITAGSRGIKQLRRSSADESSLTWISQRLNDDGSLFSSAVACCTRLETV